MENSFHQICPVQPHLPAWPSQPDWLTGRVANLQVEDSITTHLQVMEIGSPSKNGHYLWHEVPPLPKFHPSHALPSNPQVLATLSLQAFWLVKKPNRDWI